MTTNTIDPKDFRRALSQFATGVTIITTQDEEQKPVGVTASSFNSVSMDPPLILWSIDKGANSLPAFESSDHFAVNVLNNTQSDTSNNFAQRGIDKFSNADYSLSANGSPLLSDYVAQFECKRWAMYEGGDHLIIVGEVLDYRYKDENEPLIFSRGSYGSPIQLSGTDTESQQQDGVANEDFIPNYLLYLLRKTFQKFSTKLYASLKSNCNITADEWRVLARMSDHQTIAIDVLAKMVMQPEVALRETANRMISKAYIENVGDNQLAITETGLVLAKKVQMLALENETQVLKPLSSDSVAELKASLKKLN